MKKITWFDVFFCLLAGIGLLRMDFVMNSEYSWLAKNGNVATAEVIDFRPVDRGRSIPVVLFRVGETPVLTELKYFSELHVGDQIEVYYNTNGDRRMTSQKGLSKNYALPAISILLFLGSIVSFVAVMDRHFNKNKSSA